MRAAVSENRRSITCFAWIGYTRAEPPAANPGETGIGAALGPPWDYSPASPCCRADVSPGPFSHCGNGSGKLFGPCGFFSRVSDRMFTRSDHAAVAVSRGVVSETTVVEAVPAAVVTPGVVTRFPPATQSGDRHARLDRFVHRPEPDQPGRSDREIKTRLAVPGNGGIHAPAPDRRARAIRPAARIRGTDCTPRTCKTFTTTVTTPEPTARSAQCRACRLGPARFRGRAGPARQHPAA